MWVEISPYRSNEQSLQKPFSFLVWSTLLQAVLVAIHKSFMVYVLNFVLNFYVKEELIKWSQSWFSAFQIPIGPKGYPITCPMNVFQRAPLDIWAAALKSL